MKRERKHWLGAIGIVFASMLFVDVGYAADVPPTGATTPIELTAEGLMYAGSAATAPGLAYDAATRTITLSGFTFETSASPAFIISGKVTIKVADGSENSITTTGGTSDLIKCNGAEEDFINHTTNGYHDWDGSIAMYHYDGVLDFSGSGTLELASGHVTGNQGARTRNSFGLLSVDSTVNISEATLNFSATSDAGFASGMFVHNTDIYMNGGKLDVSALGGALQSFGLTMDGTDTLQETLYYNGGEILARGTGAGIFHWPSGWDPQGGVIVYDEDPYAWIVADDVDKLVNEKTGNTAGDEPVELDLRRPVTPSSGVQTSDELDKYVNIFPYEAPAPTEIPATPLIPATPNCPTPDPDDNKNCWTGWGKNTSWTDWGKNTCWSYNKTWSYSYNKRYSVPKMVCIPQDKQFSYTEWNDFFKANCSGFDDKATYKFVGCGVPTTWSRTSTTKYGFGQCSPMTTKWINGTAYRGYTGRVEVKNSYGASSWCDIFVMCK